MGDLWTPPRGFFPAALSWFHPDNIDRFQLLALSDTDCYWYLPGPWFQNITPACDGSLIGHPVHVWIGDPPYKEDFGIVTQCWGNFYKCSGITIPTTDHLTVTIGTGIAATFQDFARFMSSASSPNAPGAIRYGWLFTTRTLSWWRRDGLAIHWLGPA